MLILGIESSCDDTSVALLDCSKKGCFVVRELTASQIEIHKKYGGVVPEIAGRAHAEKIVPLIEEVLNETSPYPLLKKRGNDSSPPPLRGGRGLPATLTFAWRAGGVSQKKIVKPDVIAVTAGPGLITGLMVGVEAARALSYAWDVPLVAVNHIEGHIHSVEIRQNVISSESRLSRDDEKSPKNKHDKSEDSSHSFGMTIYYPALALVVSGGHTELIYIKKQPARHAYGVAVADGGQYQIIGKTRDDAAGECFDKVAKLLGLPYPGGPQISKLAQTGRTDAIPFPRPMIHEDNLDFSFAGLKTACLYYFQKQLSRRPSVPPSLLADFCASFEQAIVDVLVGKTLRAAKQLKPKTIILAGGVSANAKLRSALSEAIKNQTPCPSFLVPLSPYCMDNAAMIAAAGYYRARAKKFIKWNKIAADPNWIIGKRPGA